VKKFIIGIILIGVVVFLYLYLQKNSSPIEIRDGVIVSQSGNLDINAPNPTASYNVRVSGSAKNTGKVTLTNIIFEYNIAGNKVTANLHNLLPGQELYFATAQTVTKNNNPSYKLDGIKFDEDFKKKY